jgi:hypothetical protein
MRTANPIEILNSLIGREDDVGLTREERRVCLLNAFESECVNGGWNQYFWNSSGDYAQELENYLSEWGYNGAIEAFAVLKEAMGGTIPSEREVRIRALESISEETCVRVNVLVGTDIDRIFEDICEYIRTHSEHFIRGGA